MPTMRSALSLTVYCLCADWCRTCDAYRETFDALARTHKARWVWVDIEEHDALMGDVDIENFPTLLLADAEHVYFFGTVLPQAGVAARLVERALHGDHPPLDAPEAQALLQRLRESGLGLGNED